MLDGQENQRHVLEPVGAIKNMIRKSKQQHAAAVQTNISDIVALFAQFAYLSVLSQTPYCIESQNACLFAENIPFQASLLTAVRVEDQWCSSCLRLFSPSLHAGREREKEMHTPWLELAALEVKEVP